MIPVGITREGAFVLEEDRAEKFALDAAKLPEVVENGTRVLWPEAGGERVLSVRHSDGQIEELGRIDAVLPILHGVHGEDGTIQGFFDTLGIPYAGARVLDSAMCMDKHFMKVALAASSIPVAPWVTVRPWELEADAAGVHERAAALGDTLFVKPSRAGSSVGVSRVDSIDDLDAALSIAFAEDDKVLIEPAMVGREIEVAVLEGRESGSARASQPGEIVLTTREFYDFEGKYLGGDGVEVRCPAELTDEEIADLRAMALASFAAVDGQGLARVDFFLTPDGPVVNELNTMPGFTPISMFPKCWEASGLSYPELITELIEQALSRSV